MLFQIPLSAKIVYKSTINTNWQSLSVSFCTGPPIYLLECFNYFSCCIRDILYIYNSLEISAVMFFFTSPKDNVFSGFSLAELIGLPWALFIQFLISLDEHIIFLLTITFKSLIRSLTKYNQASIVADVLYEDFDDPVFSNCNNWPLCWGTMGFTASSAWMYSQRIPDTTSWL